MLSSAVPARFPIPWANSAGGSFVRPIPEASQIGIQAGAASLTDGFVPVNFTQIAAGGVPPFGQDANGILKQITQIQQWQQAGGGWTYDSAFATKIGGYPKGAILNSAVVPGKRWVTLVESNFTDPDSASSVFWYTPIGEVPSGTLIPSFIGLAAVLPMVPANGLTIGDAASNATSFADSRALFLYDHIWTYFSNSFCPILTSGGVPTTRGANSFADFAAHKQLTTPNMKGAGLRGVDTMGGAASNNLSNVPIQRGSATLPTSIVGENLHGLVGAENGPHAHGVTDPGHIHSITDPGHHHTYQTNSQIRQDGTVTNDAMCTPTGANTGDSFTGISINSANAGVSVQSNGSGTPHNNVAFDMLVWWNLTL